MKWPVHDAKAKLSELIERARAEGPQIITRHGREQAVVMSVEAFQKLESHRIDLKTYLLSGPRVDGFEVERPRDFGREVKL